MIAVSTYGFAGTNAVAFVGLICAEAFWNQMPDYSWRFGSRLLDGAIRGFGAFLFYSPIIQVKIILGVALISIVFAVLERVARQPAASHANSRQFTIETALAGVYFCAVIAWFVQAVMSVYAARQF